MNNQVVVIGIGGFGTYITKQLSKYQFSVIAIDKDQDQIEKIKDYVDRAITMDATNEDNLEEISWANVDIAIISIGDPNLEASIMSVALMKQLGVRRIICRASSQLHERILRKIGAHEIINPERDIAEMLVNRLVLPNVFDMKFFDEENVLTEFIPPANFIGKSFYDLDLRNKYKISVVVIKRFNKKNELLSKPKIIPNPLPSERILENDVLIGIGKKEDFEKL